MATNPGIRDLSWDGIRYLFFEDQRDWRYFPLTYLSFAVDYAFAGVDPAMYHLTNLLLHLANTALVLVLVRRLSGDPLAAGLTALLFGVHPLQVESVAWVMGRKNVLFLLFFLLSLLAYLGWARPPPGRPWRAWAALACSCGLFTLAVLAKPAAVTLPALLLLLDHHLEPEPPRRLVPFLLRSLPSKLVYLPVVGASWLLTSRLAQSNPYVADLAFDLPSWLVITAHNLFFYVAKAVAPLHLGVFYPLPVGDEGPFLPPHFVVFALLGLGLVALCLWSRRRNRTLFFGSAWYLITILPMAAAPWIFRDLPILAADRYFYQSSIGLFYCVGVGFGTGWHRAFGAPRSVRAALAGVLVAGVGILLVLSWQQRRVWRETIPLYEQTVRHHPSDAFYYRLAIEYAARGRMEPAFLALYGAEQAPRKIFFGRVFAYQMRISDLYRRQGDYLKAAAFLEAAIESTPNSIEPVRTATPLAYRYLAHLRDLAGDEAGAAAARERAGEVDVAPESYFEHLWFVMAPDASLRFLEARVAREPGDAVAWHYLGEWYALRSQPEEAQRYKARAAQLGFDPSR